jgi:KDO2-lipid IV(A) lauroyltransferase
MESATATMPRTSALPAGLREDWPVPWQPAWGPRNGPLAHLEYWLLQVVLGGASRLPPRAFGALASGLAHLARVVDRRHSESARIYLTQALGEMPRAELERRVVQAYRHLLTMVVEGERFARLVPPEELREHFDLDFSDEVWRVREEGRGSVFVTAHVGDWEAASSLLPWIGFDPVYAFARPPKNRPMSKAIQRARERRGIRILPRRGGMLDARAVIRAGGCIGMLLDQRGRKKPIVAPFFGRPALCDRSAGVLLRRLGAPVMIGASYRTDVRLRYRVVCRTVLRPAEVADLAPEELATRINRELEQLILAAPDQYLWLHDRYKGAPEAGAPAGVRAVASGDPQEDAGAGR